MRLLITGAAGFIGGAVYKEAAMNGEKWSLTRVVGVDWDESLCNKISNSIDKKLMTQDSSMLCIDFASLKVLKSIESGDYDCVIHLAALPRVAYSVENPRKTDENNINKSVALLEACLKSNTPMVFASSSSVYGGAKEMPTTENEQLSPVSPYALQKATFEKYLEIYKNLKNYKSISLRFFNVYGPGQDGSSAYSTVLSAWMYGIRNKKEITLEGDGEQRRDFCYVGDVVNACLLSVKKVNSVQGSFNIACGANHSCNELLKHLGNKFGSEAIIVNRIPERVGDVKETLADISKASSLLGYVPHVTFWDGVDKTVDWWFC